MTSRRVSRNAAHKWRRTIDLSDDRLVELVRKDRVDMLVDLVGHMKGNRLRVFALKPAPIQVTAVGRTHWHRPRKPSTTYSQIRW